MALATMNPRRKYGPLRWYDLLIWPGLVLLVLVVLLWASLDYAWWRMTRRRSFPVDPEPPFGAEGYER